MTCHEKRGEDIIILRNYNVVSKKTEGWILLSCSSWFRPQSVLWYDHSCYVWMICVVLWWSMVCCDKLVVCFGKLVVRCNKWWYFVYGNCWDFVLSVSSSCFFVTVLSLFHAYFIVLETPNAGIISPSLGPETCAVTLRHRLGNDAIRHLPPFRYHPPARDVVGDASAPRAISCHPGKKWTRTLFVNTVASRTLRRLLEARWGFHGCTCRRFFRRLNKWLSEWVITNIMPPWDEVSSNIVCQHRGLAHSTQASRGKVGFLQCTGRRVFRRGVYSPVCALSLHSTVDIVYHWKRKRLCCI